MEIRDHPYLYQWDRNRELSVPEENAAYVDFARSGTDEPLRIAVTDGVVKIPDSWLQIAGNRNVYVCYTDGTMQGYTLMVRPRPKPPDYVAAPDTVLDTPVTIPAGGVGKIEYEIKINLPIDEA